MKKENFFNSNFRIHLDKLIFKLSYCHKPRNVFENKRKMAENFERFYNFLFYFVEIIHCSKINHQEKHKRHKIHQIQSTSHQRILMIEHQGNIIRRHDFNEIKQFNTPMMFYCLLSASKIQADNMVRSGQN